MWGRFATCRRSCTPPVVRRLQIGAQAKPAPQGTASNLYYSPQKERSPVGQVPDLPFRRKIKRPHSNYSPNNPNIAKKNAASAGRCCIG